MRCGYHEAGACRSCTLMGRPYPEQLAEKSRHCAELLDRPGLEWLEPVPGQESGYRNKAKMVVGGTVEEPTLGILGPQGAGVDLRGCGVLTPGLRAVMPALAGFVTRARLTPYDVPARRGELKHLLLTEAPDGRIMLRFVLRSTESLPRIRKHLPALLTAEPPLTVVSANLLPEHKAVLEGAEEVPLAGPETLPVRAGDLVLHLLPRSFFQTNTEVAGALYRQAREWVEELAPAALWDLYCGVGGFALHTAAPGRSVTGVELSPAAVRAAERARDEAGVPARFVAGDATAFARDASTVPDLVIVNPPRRGLGAELAGWLEESGVEHVVYSSCSAPSLARDLDAMPSLRPRRARLLDMFPQTAHYEVIVRLSRTG